METLASRLDACQETLLELYEKDSDQLQDQIKHWQHVRWENVLLFKAREAGITHLAHQVVPVLGIAKAKACKAIEIQLALKTLLNSPYSNERWTLRDTSQEMWDAVPKQCWKKKGYTVEVRYDCKEEKTMCYTCWREIYVQNSTNETWEKVCGLVDHAGIYYLHDGIRVDCVLFSKEAVIYGDTGIWEVHVGSRVIYDAFDSSVSSTQDTEQDQVPTIKPTDHGPDSHPQQASTTTQVLGTNETQVSTPPFKRQRLGDRQRTLEQPDSTKAPQQLARVNLRTQCDTDGAHEHGRTRDCNSAPVIHLRGEANKLKCLRYRLQKHKSVLFAKASSTWHWATGTEDNTCKTTFVTLWHDSVEQRAQFLATVHIPKGIEALPGYMSLFA